ncbi:methylenetetrahydrofolate dehydrogenase/methylenetetrahydrofolate cyclohydrolase [Spiroplasma sabaudiense Ar-1343]|uniref:Bifunctional protein FolD n=1 Tax=Spiroplasma sabaudiense Ar-1343 TaxID=1276257 RepID=W6A9G5_9MOLU|nr:bifunctional 5,10-methylenetetrahydrofolate dehydrogenase/5,10-methenyltetrahydrofolate cyclohydrolase [Spiroplasma sabaudiense]AHI53525.1 methylenetetrahydrofolate dehydrogenase/methylenetetrahydrofolate cyclohydrolase [Spiroplasma sabaudiense Ar-1343]
MKLLDGKALAAKRSAIIKAEISQYQSYRKPKLTVILVGNDSASEIYVQHKQRACEKVGIIFELVRFQEQCEPQSVLKEIESLNENPTVDGILIQLPLPQKWKQEDFLQAVIPSKDVDGFHYINQGKLYQGNEKFTPCTPQGIIELLSEYQINLVSKKVAVIGTSNIVGKPLVGMLINRGATVFACNKNTKNIAELTRIADIVISATGSQFLITKNMLKKDVIVVDVGIIRDPITNKLVGDVDFESVKDIVSFITPVPGGVGPMTVEILLENTLKAYKKTIKL